MKLATQRNNVTVFHKGLRAVYYFQMETMYTAASPSFGRLKRLRYDTEEAAAASANLPQEHSFLQPQEDEFDKFGAVVACKLRRMTRVQEIYAEHLINQVLFHGMMDRLNESSTLDVVTTNNN